MKKLFLCILMASLCSVAFAIEQYDLERVSPLLGKSYFTTNFGEFRSIKKTAYTYTQHDGLDYQATEGTNVYLVCGGTVTTGYDPTGWGKYMIIDSTKGGKT